jgi:ubiquinone/menaquinone biosynthesis C-methylase UbiE
MLFCTGLLPFNADDTERGIMSEKEINVVPDEVGSLYDRLVTRCTAPERVNSLTGYNLHVGYWDDPDSEVPMSEAADRMTDIIVEKLKIGSGSHVLDVGCGVGGPGMRIARLTGARVTGISVSREQIKAANSFVESEGLAERVVFQYANAMEMPFPAQSFDAAIALESILHMPDRGQVLSQICRSLRPGGRLVLTDFFERAPMPAAKQPVVDRFLNKIMVTVARAEDYPSLLRHAGMWFDEILDISEQTMAKSIAWRRWVYEKDFADEEMIRQSEGAEAIIPEIGYLVVVGHRDYSTEN